MLTSRGLCVLDGRHGVALPSIIYTKVHALEKRTRYLRRLTARLACFNFRNDEADMRFAHVFPAAYRHTSEPFGEWPIIWLYLPNRSGVFTLMLVIFALRPDLEIAVRASVSPSDHQSDYYSWYERCHYQIHICAYECTHKHAYMHIRGVLTQTRTPQAGYRENRKKKGRARERTSKGV